jgi:Uma2 family endonuclease
MSTTLDTTAPETLADAIARLGDIPLDRIRWNPHPGTATIDDAIRTKRCELIDGVLVEKAMGWFEGRVGQILGEYLGMWMALTKVGYINGEGSYMRLRTGDIRIPDLYFVRWERVPGHQVPDDVVTTIPPHVAVEVLSEGNTTKEIERKRNEFLAAGAEQVWVIDPRQETIEVWAGPDSMTLLTVDDTLSGGSSIPGFELPVRELFAAARRGSVDLDLVRRWIGLNGEGESP